MAFTGSAVAGGGNSANAPGQQKQDQAAAQPQASQPTAQQTPPGQAKKASSTSSSTPQAGVKPSSTTKHWTHSTVGASPDVSKRYGNGKTAAQIAASRGAPSSQPLTGPGNSQPHKTYDCRHKVNKSGGVDVHAIKSYSSTSCTTTQAATTPPTAPCGFTVVATTTLTGPAHGHGKGLVHNKHETASTTYSVQPDSTQSCSSVTPQVAPQVTPQVAPQVTPQVTPTQSSTPQAGAGALPSTQGVPSTGGVLGAQTTLATPKTHPHHGVLGTVAHISGTSLPFTGFPLWIAVLIAAALIVAGVTFRRRGLPA
jgi:hypothetical protein